MHTVKEAMSTDVVTVGPDVPVTAAARIMRDAGVSGLPVIDSDGRVVGILTEADLLHRAVVADPTEMTTHRSRDRWSASTVAELMSRNVLGVRRDDPLAKAARLMETARVRRLVVVGEGFALEGIISRRDVVGALARSDAEIETEIRFVVIDQILGLDPNAVDIKVHDGVVRMAGVVPDRREACRLERLAAKVLGVSHVESTVAWGVDATSPRRWSRLTGFATSRAAPDRVRQRPQRSHAATYAPETEQPTTEGR